MGRWLAQSGHGPEPANWNREVAAAYVAAVDRSTIGQWSTGAGTPRLRAGQLFKPATKASALTALRRFFRDCQEWNWIVGGLAGGGAGAGIGAASGGALGLGANALTHGKDIDLKPEQLLQFRTSSPLDVRIMLVDGQQIVPQGMSTAPLQARPDVPVQPQ